MRRFFINNRLLWGLGLFLCLAGCVEEIDFETANEFDSALVVEGTITNELKRHQIKLTRTYRFEEYWPPYERWAQVKVVDDMGNVHQFQEQGQGIYISSEEFQAMEGRSYSLEIETADGGRYKSEPTEMAPSADIEAVVAQRVAGVNGQDGVAMVLEGAMSQEGDAYYRYEYEETFKIVSPYYKALDLVVEGGELVLVPKAKEEYTCYRTEASEDFVVASTERLSEDKVNGLVVRFIESGNSIISHRYSILVKQFGVTQEAYRFYKTLKNLSESESLFSQIQPGFLSGNMSSVDNPEEKVLGFFSVSEVTTGRGFFSFTDFYGEDDKRPDFIRLCEEVTLPNNEILKRRIQSGVVKFFKELAPGEYSVMRSPCIDCTLSGTNVVPEFWVEEDE